MCVWPWLIEVEKETLEVNASPSLARDNALDREVKDALLADTLDGLGRRCFDAAQCASW